MFSLRVGLDLGSSNVRINVAGKVEVEGPSLVVVDVNSREVKAVGEKAKEMLGKTLSGIEAIYPIERGRVRDFSTAEAMLRFYFRQISRVRTLDLRFVLPVTASSVDKICLIRLAKLLRSGSVEFVRSPIATVLASGVEMKQPGGLLIIDIGSGKTDISVVSLGKIITAGCVRVGGRDIGLAIARSVRKEYGLIVNQSIVDTLQSSLVSASQNGNVLERNIAGLDASSGLPSERKVSSELINPALADTMKRIANGVAEVLRRTPCELCADLLDNGAILVGGCAKMSGISQFLGDYIGIPIRVVDTPEHCACLGCSLASDKQIERAGGF
ncbi:rod shape-determining protein [bacterium]|nr:rod shape-determining protein [bacterium]